MAAWSDRDDTAHIDEERVARQLEIQAGRVAIVFDSQPLAIMVTLLVATILAVVLWPVISHDTILTWLALTYLVNTWRWGWYSRFKATPSKQRRALAWGYRATAGGLLAGLVWGSAGLVLFPPENLVYQVLLVICITGILAGAVTTLSAMLPVAVGFLLFSAVPLILRLASNEVGIAPAVGFFSVLLLLVLLGSAYRLNRFITETLSERHGRLMAEKIALRQARYDALTELPNRRFFVERLAQEMQRAIRHRQRGALLFIDLDNFKHINDSLGHQIGDELLRKVAERIGARVRSEDTVARLGGDEFVVLLPHVDGEEGHAVGRAQEFAAGLCRILAAPYHVCDHELQVSASIGIAMFPDDGHRPETILTHADTAMYQAKKAGRDTTRFFHPSMQEAANNRLTLQRELRQALEREELFLVYQTQVDDGGRTIGVEALLRWNHPTRGLVMPADFIGVAEETGLILPIGERVLEMACRGLAEITRHQRIRISVNVSPRQFRQDGFVDQILNVLATGGADHRLICLEITESSIMDDIELAVKKIERLRNEGICIALDDFGTGYSSLSQLRRLPLDKIKIDRSFIREVTSVSDDAAIVETIILLAHRLGLDVIAEGVDSDEIRDFLVAKGCRGFQGFLFGRPVSEAALVDGFDGAALSASEASVLHKTSLPMGKGCVQK